MEFCRVYHEIKAPTNRQYGKPEITGKVVFTPDLQKGEVWTDNGVVVPALPITCDVIDGKMYDRNGEYPSRYANLMAGGPDANPNTMNWRVSYHDMRVGDEHFYIEPFIFKAIPYVKVNLKDVTPVAGYTPPGVIRGATGSPGIGIIFKGIVLTQDDLPVDGVENNHAYAITNTKDLAVWQDNEWLIIPNFANFDVTLEDISDLLYEARTNAEFSREQVGEMDRLRALSEKYSQAARDAVDLGRSYIRKMEDHVSESITAAGRAEDLASQAAAAAEEAVRILDQLDPLRDDVDAAHAEVARLHDEASQFTAQAAEHVRLASQHSADAVASASSASRHAAEGKQYAADALAEADKAQQFVGQASTHAETARGHAATAKSHMDEGTRQAGLAAGSATSALQNANRAEQIMDDADGILSQVQGYSQDAKNALNGAESLLANAGGQGKSLGDVLLEVARKHNETLNAHDTILDLHADVLDKHSEAIRYVAMAAAQAGSAAMHAAQAAQEALDVAYNAAKAAESAADAADAAGVVADAALKTGQDAAKAASSASAAASDAGKAAGSAGKAADEAAKAASNNSAAITKLQEADTKLQEADRKLQSQMRVLEESQRTLARAVQILAGAVAHAAMSAQNAAMAADNAGKAAEQALDAIDANTQADIARDQAIEAFQQTQTEIDGMQNDAIAALEAQAAEIAELQNLSVNTAMVESLGSTHPDVTTEGIPVAEGDPPDPGYDIKLANAAPGTKAHADFYDRVGTGGELKYVTSRIYTVSSGVLWFHVTSRNRVVNLMWAQPSAQQVPISLSSNGMSSLDRVTWKDLSGLSRTATGRVTNGQLTIRCTWNAANRGSTYGIRVLVGTSVFRSFTTTTLGPLSFIGDGESRFSVSVTNLKMNAGQTFKVQVYSSAGNPNQRSMKSGTVVGSWVEHSS